MSLRWAFYQGYTILQTLYLTSVVRILTYQHNDFTVEAEPGAGWQAGPGAAGVVPL